MTESTPSGRRSMPMKSGSNVRPVTGRRVRWPMAALAAWALVPIGVTIADEGTPVAPPRPAANARTARNLDHRVNVLSKALDLDAAQRAELSKIFASQREAVKKIWSDPTLLAAERAPATRAAEDRTADQIRAILTDEQKKKYNPPKPPTAPDKKPPDVSAWMDATHKK
jgi:hypothetical protein